MTAATRSAALAGSTVPSGSRASGDGGEGAGTRYALPSRGGQPHERKYSRQGSRAHTADVGGMGAPSLGASLWRGDTADGPREAPLRSSTAVLPGSHYAGGGGALLHSAYGARPSSRPTSSALAPNAPSPRAHQQHSTTYRDAALMAAQHGLSAYAPSAAAAAAAAVATRNLPAHPRGHGGLPASSHPRHMHHTAPHLYHTNERLPSRGGMPPSRGALPPSRPGPGPGSGPGPPLSRGGPPPPASPSGFGRKHDVGLAHTADAVMLRDAFEAADADAAAGAPYGSAIPIVPMAMTTGLRGLATASGSPAAYEVDGRPGTRGGGPGYDIEGRPTGRGGQRPPSRAQLGLAMTQKPSHVPPLSMASWAGSLGGGPRPGTGPESPSPGPGGGGTASGGDGAGGAGSPTLYDSSLSGSLRRQSVPLPLAPSMTAALAGASATPPAASNGGPLPHANGAASNGLAASGRLGPRLSSIAEAPFPSPSASFEGERPDSPGGGTGSPGRRGGGERHLDGIAEEDPHDVDASNCIYDQDSNGRGSGRNRPHLARPHSTNSSSAGSSGNGRQLSARAVERQGSHREATAHTSPTTAAATAAATVALKTASKPQHGHSGPAAQA